jgi:hypothetical protein
MQTEKAKRLFLFVVCYNLIEVISLKYKIEIEINEKKDRVAALYVNKNLMHLWEQGLIRVESYEKTLFETGSQGALVFITDQKEMLMKVTVEDNHLPESISVIYELPGAWNRFTIQFKEIKHKTVCHIESEFKFDQPHQIPLEAFIQKTTEGMNQFKQFVEGIKK